MKKGFILTICFITIFSITGCSQKQIVNNDNSKPENREFRRPDFGQPERKADISGLVKSIIGNEVTILKIERPQRDRNEENTTGQNSRNANSGQNDSAPAFGGANNRQPGTGQGMRGNFNQRNSDPEAQKAMLERLKKMSSGEEKVLIPVGIKMLKPDTNVADKPSMVEATLNDITKDKMINIWLNEENNASPADKTASSSADNSSKRNIASFVMIMR